MIDHMEKALSAAIFEAMEAKGWSAAELSRRSGVSYDVIAKLRTRPGSSTAAENVALLHKALGIGSDAPNPESDLVAVHDVEASAGHGATVYDEDVVAQLSFPPGYLAKLTTAKPKDLRIITVKGDSMLPTLADDDVVMIDTTKRDLSYDGLFVMRDTGAALFVKRVGRASMRGYVTIISDNRDVYPTVEKQLGDIEVIGRVIWKGGKA